jgi:hypothetical protein
MQQTQSPDWRLNPNAHEIAASVRLRQDQASIAVVTYRRPVTLRKSAICWRREWPGFAVRSGEYKGVRYDEIADGSVYDVRARQRWKDMSSFQRHVDSTQPSGGASPGSH